MVEEPNLTSNREAKVSNNALQHTDDHVVLLAILLTLDERQLTPIEVGLLHSVVIPVFITRLNKFGSEIGEFQIDPSNGTYPRITRLLTDMNHGWVDIVGHRVSLGKGARITRDFVEHALSKEEYAHIKLASERACEALLVRLNEQSAA